jgi:hypothetical protein
MNKKPILAALLLCATLYAPLSLFSQSQDFVINGTALVSYRGIKADVTIPEGVTAIGDHAFSLYTGLASVKIPASVTSIGDFAFAGCTSLASVTIPESVTYIGKSAFAYCSSLTDITIPPNITYIGFSAFGGCNSLSTVRLYHVIILRMITIGEDAFPADTRFIYIETNNALAKDGIVKG